MKIVKELEINYIRAIQKRSCERTRNDEGNIRKRNDHIESQFEFTTEVCEKLILLNEKLRQEERRIFYQNRLIEKQCKLLLKNKEIDGFNIGVVVEYWNNKHYKKYDPLIDGNPFFKTTDDFMIHQTTEMEYHTKPHNEHHNRAPLPEINHCYSFHSLYDHCNELTWFDIYKIDEIWMEIKVDYQFSSKIK